MNIKVSTPDDISGLNEALFKETADVLRDYTFQIKYEDLPEILEDELTISTESFLHGSVELNLLDVLVISRKLCCSKTPDELGKVWLGVLEEIIKAVPLVALYAVPSCIYRGGICTQDDPCGYNSKALAELIEQVPEKIYRKVRNDKAIRDAKSKIQ